MNEFGISEDKIYRMMKDDLFPKAVRVGLRGTAWHAEEIWAWKQALPRSDATNDNKPTT